jgi:hypothetical protein
MLPGLNRLIEICQRHSLRLKRSPPVTSAPQQGEVLLGAPLDPQLAAVYRRLSAAEFGELALYEPTPDEGGLIPENTWLRQRGQIQYSSALVFGWEPGFSFYYGTVPQLADATGIQPVIYIEAMDVLFAVPIASSVDRFFDLYSRYLELMVQDPSYLSSGLPHVQFPWHVRTYVAQDFPLIHQVRAGRFDFLSNNYRGALKWLQELRDVPP